MKIPKYIYTEAYSPSLMQTHYLAKVSFHHFWLETFDDLTQFWGCDLYDTRMTVAYPVGVRA